MAINEPDIKLYDINKPTNFVFDTIPSWKDYFISLHAHRQLVIKEFHQLLSKKSQSCLDSYQNPSAIGVHIRMGDFKQLKEGEDFKLLGATRTPLTYFKQCILEIRAQLGTEIPAIVYTDGYPSELEEILKLDNTHLNETKFDIVDLINLSKSKIIITSAHSSFSEWAGFISDAPIIRHPDHIHGKIRSEENLFEGTLTQFITTLK